MKTSHSKKQYLEEDTSLEECMKFFWWKYTVYTFFICLGIVMPLFSDKDLRGIYTIILVGVCGIVFCIRQKKCSPIDKIKFWSSNGFLLILYFLYLGGEELKFPGINWESEEIEWVYCLLLSTTFIICAIRAGKALQFWLLKSEKASYFAIIWRGLATLAIIMLIIPIIANKNKINNDENKNPNSIDQTDYIALVISCCSCAAVALTLVIQGKQLENSQRIQQQTYDSQILETIDQFSPTVKDKCTQLREILQDKDSYLCLQTINDIKFAFERQLRDDYYINEKYRLFRKKNTNYQYYVAFTQFVRHFEKLSLYDLNAHTASALYFYYIWWREFLKKMIGHFDAVKKEVEISKPDLIVPQWIDLCDRMDKVFKDLGHKIPTSSSFE